MVFSCVSHIFSGAGSISISTDNFSIFGGQPNVLENISRLGSLSYAAILETVVVCFAFK